MKIIFIILVLFLAINFGCNDKRINQKESDKMNFENHKFNDKNISWGISVDNIMCGLFFEKIKYKIGEAIIGTCYIKNLSKHNMEIIKQPVKLRDYTIIISGPPDGVYNWKGPQISFKPITNDEFTTLKPSEFLKFTVSTSAHIGQKVKPGGGDWNTVLPGKYTIKISISNLFEEKQIYSGIIEIEVIE